MSSNYTRQYEAPVKPENWTGDALRFYRMLIDVLDDIYLKYGRIDEKMIGSALRAKINSKADSGEVAEIALEQGKLTASFTALSGEVTQLSVDVNGLNVLVTDTAKDLQSQINQTPGLISVAVGNIHVGGTNLLLNSADGITTANYEVKSYYLSEPLTTGETVTVQIWGSLGRDRTAFSVYNSGGHQFLRYAEWDGSKYACTFAWQEYGDNNRITIWQAPSDGTTSSTINRIKLERGNKGTDWVPSPKDPTTAYEVIDGSQLHITKDSVRIDTPVFDINVSGADGDAHFGAKGMAVDVVNSPSVMPRYMGPTTLSVGGNPDGVNRFATLTDALAMLCDRFIPSTVTIYMDADTAENTAVLCNTVGGNININGGNRTVNGKIQLKDVGNKVTIQQLTIATNGGGNVVEALQCTHATLNNCKVIGDGGGVYFGCNWFSSRGSLMNCEINNAYMAARANGGSALYLQNCVGSGNTYACGSYQASLLGMYGSRPDATYGLYCERGSWMSDDPGASGGSSEAPVEPTITTTITLTATNTRTYGGGWYSGTNVLSQGVSGGTNFYGMMWFDLSAIAGKTIKSASIRLYRRAGVGRGVPVEVYVGTHNASGPSGGTNLVNAYGSHLVGMVDQKETLSAAVATAAVQELANGSAKGLYTHSNAGGYAQFDGYDGGKPPQLTVTYQ